MRTLRTLLLTIGLTLGGLTLALHAAEIVCVMRNGWNDCVVVESCWTAVKQGRLLSVWFDWAEGYCRW